MALFSQGSYSELLDIIARETVQAFIDARLNVCFDLIRNDKNNNKKCFVQYLTKRSKKRLRIADERVEEIRKALQMCNGKYGNIVSN